MDPMTTLILGFLVEIPAFCIHGESETINDFLWVLVGKGF